MRKRIAISAAVLALALAGARALWVGIEAAALDRTVARFEERWGRLGLGGLGPEPVEPARNAARYFRAAADLLDYGPGADEAVRGRGARMSVVRRVAADPGAVRAVLEANRISLSLAAEGASMKTSDWEIRYESGVQAGLPRLLDLLNLSRVMAAGAALHVEEGRIDEGIEMIAKGLALSASLRREENLIVELTGASIEGTLLDVARTLLARGDLRAGHLERLRGLVLDLPGPETFEGALMGETAFVHAALDDLAAGRSSEVRAPREGLLARAGAWLLRPSLLEAHAWYLEEMSRYLALCKMPPHARPAEEPAPGIPWFARAISVLPDNRGILRRADLAAARADLAVTAIALRRYRLDHGGWPESLADLTPAYLPSEIPDPFTGRPFEYAPGESGVRLRSAGEEVADRPGWISDPLMIWDLPS